MSTKKYYKQYYQEHKEECLQRIKKYCQTPKGKLKRRQWQKKRYDEIKSNGVWTY